MKRFVTYLYAYREGQKITNTGYIRVDVRGHILDMQVNVKETNLNNAKGVFYIIVKTEKISKILLTEFFMKAGQYSGRVVCNCKELEEEPFEMENILGVCISYECGEYMASCWRDGEEEVIANEDFMISDTTEVEKVHEDCNDEKTDEKMQAASVEMTEVFVNEMEPFYKKINLNEISTLPSEYWHFSNNSFLMHGFWNYGYLVLKESLEENQKGIALGVPGIFEQPEMVMATYFGFPEFEALPLQAMEMEIGQSCSCDDGEKNQQPQAGTFGCWFVNL